MSEYYDPETYPKQWNYLQPGTVVDDYIIEREIAHGGFSSVYLARHRKTQVQVAIKEYLPRKLAHRTWNNNIVANTEQTKKLFVHGRSLFVEEAKVLATLKHTNIVEVVSFFHANSTVYLVMNYAYGITLDKLLLGQTININSQWLNNIFSSMLEGLSLIHQHNMLHLDIKPANLMITPDNSALLLDFGAIQAFPLTKAKQKSQVLSKGFSPPEQYSANGVLGPFSDIYSVGASMRACLDLNVPPEAPGRVGNDEFPLAQKAYADAFDLKLLAIIDWCMELGPADRPQSIKELQDALSSLR
ncbi:serine/threonine protein kinase [Methyloprofundus sp.]|uniref:serine/threonine protein kinase n=1 Tax=Methyloprofundus sp. TaxID=2020875 RepID=UPI003D0B373D